MFSIWRKVRKASEETKCQIFDQLLLQKLMFNQADLDSIEVSETQVDGELDRTDAILCETNRV